MNKSLCTRILLTCLALGISVACATTGGAKDAPGWTTGDSDKYPKGKYLVGVGVGDSKAAAEDDARAQIAKIFRVQIESLTQSLSQYIGYVNSKGKESWISGNDISTLTRSYTNEILSGVEIAERWNSPKAQVYALAVLERNSARNRLEQQVMEMDGEIAGLMEEAAKATDKISSIKLALRALDSMKKRSVINNQLMVVNPLGQGVDSEVNPGLLNGKLVGYLANLKLYVEVEGDGGDRIKQAVVESITRGGLQVQETDAEADILIKGSVTGKPVNRASDTGLKFGQFEAKIEMVSAETGATFGSINELRKEGAMDLQDARERCLFTLSKIIVEKFNKELYSFLTK